MLLLLFNLLLFLSQAKICVARTAGPIDPGSVYPNLRRFESRSSLENSFLWHNLMSENSRVSPENNVFYLDDTRTIMVISDKSLYGASRFALFKKASSEVIFTEIDLGTEIRSVGSTFFPLATASAEASAGSVIVEREVSHARSINFSPSISQALQMAQSGLGIALNLGENLAMFNKETITCTADPGGRVQLQVTNAMVHFPGARTRVVTYKRKKSVWSSGPWETIMSHLADEKHVGALFYENFRLGRHRCVTNASHFEDSSRRKWIEWNLPWSV